LRIIAGASPDARAPRPETRREPVRDTDLLDEARRLRINISETLEHRPRNIVRAEQEKRWLEENREAIASINSFIDHHGLLASKLRYRRDDMRACP
jgi:antitoxin CcdA